MREYLRKISLIKYLVIIWRTFRPSYGLTNRVKSLFSFFHNYLKFKKLARNYSYNVDSYDIYPRIYDKTASHKIDPVYFFQGTWCARKIFENKPSEHFDVGSQSFMVGIISQFTPTTMIDIRELPIILSGLSCKKGDITKLSFKKNSISSLSSICVIEHIGLGRYGDKLDQFGTEKAADELARVLASGGNLYISVPIDSCNKIYFNAHRAFTRDYVLKMFQNLKLKEEQYIYGRELLPSYSPERGFGTGLYHFTK
ncbi:MAG: hypothetical protein RL557_275 [archaeon]|jgi:hypothetical protein